MEIPVVGISVQHKGMAAAVAAAPVKDRVAAVELGHHHFIPFRSSNVSVLFPVGDDGYDIDHYGKGCKHDKLEAEVGKTAALQAD